MNTKLLKSSTQQLPSHRRVWLPVLLVIVGMLVMSYPVVSTVLHNLATTRAAQEYSRLEKQIPQEQLNQAWEDAHFYNETRTAGAILDPWLEEFVPDGPSYLDYKNYLADTSAMARVIIPSIKVDLPVYHGTQDETLQKGLGHLFGSDLPVGGNNTHAVITGHTGLPTATMFDNLPDLNEGDSIYIQVAGHKLKYEVDQIKVVLPNETDDLAVFHGHDYLTLVTCTPYGINSHRLLVRGHQVDLDPADASIFDSTHGPGWQWWMYALVALVVVIGLTLMWWLLRLRNGMNSAAALAGAAALCMALSWNMLSPLSATAAPIVGQAPVGSEVNDSGMRSVRIKLSKGQDEFGNAAAGETSGIRVHARRLAGVDPSSRQALEELKSKDMSEITQQETDYHAEQLTDLDSVAEFAALPTGIYVISAPAPGPGFREIKPFLLSVPFHNLAEESADIPGVIVVKSVLSTPTPPPVVPPTTPTVPPLAPPAAPPAVPPSTVPPVAPPAAPTTVPGKKPGIPRLPMTGAQVVGMLSAGSFLILAGLMVIGVTRQRRKGAVL